MSREGEGGVRPSVWLLLLFPTISRAQGEGGGAALAHSSKEGCGQGGERLMEIQQHDGVVVEAAVISAGLRQAQREGEGGGRD